MPQETFAILRLSVVIKARTFLCTTLLMLCHLQLWSQAVTKPIPPAIPATAQETDGALPDGPDLTSELPEAHVIPPPPTGEPVKIEADTQTYVRTQGSGIYTLAGHVVIHYEDYIVSADHATYSRATSEVVAQGNVHLDGGPDDAHLIATHGTMILAQHTGHFYDVSGTLGVEQAPHSKAVFTSASPFAISGRELIQYGPQNYRVIDGTMTSCRLPNPDWRLVSKNFFLHNGKATGANSLFELDGLPLVHRIPVFYLPYVTHPMNEDSRQSGILIPIFGNDTTKGLILGEEIYFTMGRSADMTIGSEYFSKRGFSPLGQFRYKGAGYNFVTVRFHALLDRLPGTLNQGGVDFLTDGRYDLSTETRAVTDIEYLSSYTYRQAFEENYAVAINSEVKSQLFLVHKHDSLVEGISFNRYQSFESNASSSAGEQEIRILHLPTLQFDGIDSALPGTPLMWGADATASGLSRTEPGFQTSRIVPRLDFYPHLALPLHFGGWTLRPVVAVRDTFYGKSQNPGSVDIVPDERDATLDRKDVEADVDLRPPALARDFTAGWLTRLLGGDLRHVIEPDVRYRVVRGIDNFSSVLRFDDVDVASDTNELDYSLTQRLFVRHAQQHPCVGDEALGPEVLCGGETVDWLTWQVAQKYFFDPAFGGAVVPHARNVLDTTLDFSGVAFLARPRNYSPVISRLRWRTSSATDLEWDVDYDTKSGRLDSSNVFAAYHHGNYAFTVGDAHLHTLDDPSPSGASLPSAPPASTTTTTPLITDFNQLRLSAVYGSPTKLGLSGGVNMGYDFTLDTLQYNGVQATYNWNCCGLNFEVRRYSLGSVRDDTQYLYSFTLAGVGSAGSLKRAERVF
jgi:LPS-assembly protein